MRAEASYSRLVDKSILLILSYNPHTGGVCSSPLHALTYLSAAIDIITGIFHTRIFILFVFLRLIWFSSIRKYDYKNSPSKSGPTFPAPYALLEKGRWTSSSLLLIYFIRAQANSFIIIYPKFDWKCGQVFYIRHILIVEVFLSFN